MKATQSSKKRTFCCAFQRKVPALSVSYILRTEIGFPGFSYSLHCSFFFGGFPFRILNIELAKPKKELRWRLQVVPNMGDLGSNRG